MNKVKVILLNIILGLAISLHSFSQVNIPFFGNQNILNGYSKSIQGESIPYFSVYQDYAKEALLTRCTDGNKLIEWETSEIPSNAKGEYAYFSWIAAHSTGSSKGIRNFDLFINDQFVLTFTTHPNSYPKYWAFSGSDSSKIVFEFIKKDGALDAHGIAYLRVPLSKYKKNKTLKIKVIGQNQNSNDWYMTFKYSFEEKIDIEPLPFLINGEKSKKQPLFFTVLHFGKPTKLSVLIDNNSKSEFVVQNGINSFEVPIDAVLKETQVTVNATIDNLLKLNKTLTVKPIINREIYLIHHSHTDIGYSHLQEEVIKIHNQNIKNAIKYIEKTKDYPKESRFVWNIESLWDVENFLNQSNEEEKTKFFNAVRNKQIALTAFYANLMTGLCLPDEFDWLTEYATNLRDNYNLPINSTMFTDIPGLNWSIVPTLAKKGFRYFSNGLNYGEGLPDKGDRIGSSMREQGDKPFWWKSSTGRDSILFWTCGKGYSSWHRLTQGAINERGSRMTASYLNELNDKGYPYSIVHWRYNIQSDNGPNDSTLCDFVKNWNEKYSSPRLIVGNVSEMFEKFENLYGKTLPTYSGDFTPYWEDGAYSTAFEETQNRLLSAKLSQLIKLAKQKNFQINDNLLYKAKRSILMFHEHTWGSWNSISQPDDPFTTQQWDYKKRFVDSARYYISKIETSLFPKSSESSNITIYNTLNWSRSGYVEIDSPKDFIGNSITDEKGNSYPVQHLSNGKIGFIAAEIPANGQLKFHLSNAIKETLTFKNYSNFSIDSISGVISSLKCNEKEWVDNKKFRGIMQALYIKGLNPELFTTSSFKSISWVEDGPVVKRCKVNATLDGTNEIIYEISQYSGIDAIHLSVLVDKKSIREKEAIHIAFPFAIQKPVTRIGIANTFITPERGSIPGSNKDFYSSQNWIDVSNDTIGITISCPQAALFEVGNLVNELPINNGYKKWKESGNSSSTIYLYAMNNYWHTNFKADQEGIVRYDFYLYPHNSFNLETNNRNAAEVYEPLIGVLE